MPIDLRRPASRDEMAEARQRAATVVRMAAAEGANRAAIANAATEAVMSVVDPKNVKASSLKQLANAAHGAAYAAARAGKTPDEIAAAVLDATKEHVA